MCKLKRGVFRVGWEMYRDNDTLKTLNCQANSPWILDPRSPVCFIQSRPVLQSQPDFYPAIFS